MKTLLNHYSDKKLSSLLLIGFCISLLASRMLLTQTIVYGFLVWNLFLAVVPLIISERLSNKNLLPKWAFWICSLLWLLFFPNAPYLLTDFLHFRNPSDMPGWFDVLLLGTFSLAGLFFGLQSLAQMRGIWQRHFGVRNAWLLVFVCSILAGFGIYLGRFQRYNSWDLLHQPVQLIQDIFAIALHWRTIGVSLGYGMLIFVGCFYFIANTNTKHHGKFTQN